MGACHKRATTSWDQRGIRGRSGTIEARSPTYEGERGYDSSSKLMVTMGNHPEVLTAMLDPGLPALSRRQVEPYNSEQGPASWILPDFPPWARSLTWCTFAHQSERPRAPMTDTS